MRCREKGASNIMKQGYLEMFWRFISCDSWCRVFAGSSIISYLVLTNSAVHAIPAKQDSVESRENSIEEIAPPWDLAKQARELTRLGRLDEAIRVWYSILDKAERGLEDGNPAIPRILHAIGNLYREKGDYVNAEDLYRRSILSGERLQQGSEGHDPAIGMNSLGLALLGQGRFQEAVQILEKSLSMTESLGHERDKAMGSVLINLGQAYASQGRLVLASQKTKRGLEIGRSHGDLELVAVGTSNLAAIEDLLGNPREAQVLLDEALDVSIRAYGEDHLNVARVLLNLADFAARHDGEKYAKAMLTHAWQIADKQSGRGEGVAISAMNRLAILYFSEGNLKMAASLQMSALQLAKQVSGTSSPAYAKGLNMLALILEARGDHDLAVQALDRATFLQMQWLTRELPLNPVGRRSVQAEESGSYWMNAFTFAGKSNKADKLALLLRINRHGLLQEIEREQARAMKENQATRKKLAELRYLKTRLSSLTTQKQEREALSTRSEKLELELLENNPGLRLPLRSTEEIRLALPRGSILIEFQKFWPLNAVSESGERFMKPEYLAIMMTSNGKISSVNLGSSDSIDSVISQALAATAQNNRDAHGLWSRVGDMVLGPLVEDFAGVDQVFISPDAELNRVPFLALPMPKSSGKYLAQAFRLRLITSARDLLRLKQPGEASGRPVVVANPNYDGGGYVAIAQPTTVARSPKSSQSRSSDLDVNIWPPLPGSEYEGRQVAALLKTLPITGDDATTRHLQRLNAPLVLHIASHGFFLSDEASVPRYSDEVFGDVPSMLRSFMADDPMLRSGLVLAGANHPNADPDDDGYLTAAEAVNLRLNGTEMVVLSACSTGQGHVLTGEGVYGLQRALTVAGSRSTLLSLWKVDDAATAEFMSRYYRRLMAGEARTQALVATQEEFRNGTAGNGQWKDPYYWAAWQLVGDWRPIKGL
jgi:CHAT domain-containing protein